MALPDCVKARRIGLHETEYDDNGEQAPVTWTCNCGAWLTLEVLNEHDHYVATPESVRIEFLAEHTFCTAKCFKCGTVPVTRQGYWCSGCEEDEETFPF